MNSIFKFFLSAVLISLLCLNCSKKEISLINTSHLDNLYEEFSVEEKPLAIIYIYSEYPDYSKTEATGEGIACVDDAARAAVFYLRHYRYTATESSLQKARRLFDFVIYMQAENGFFYNFIDKNYQVDSTIINSKPVPDWWAWRALWALGEAYSFYTERDKEYSAKLKKHIQKTLVVINNFKDVYPQKTVYNDFELPLWLPQKAAADQAAVLIKGLIPYYLTTKDSTAAQLIEILSRGMLVMQAGDSLSFPYGAFLSWKNDWHAWGNSQADALFQAGMIFNKTDFINAAITEVSCFYPYLIKKNYLNWFRLKREQGKVAASDVKQFEQIAYGIRPMAIACLQAYRATDDTKYAKQAGQIANWLLGKNITGRVLYDPQTGRCYDGIDNKSKINLNSGAESTIEALLTLLAVEQNPISRRTVHNYYQDKSQH
jgi:hypothetical protein